MSISPELKLLQYHIGQPLELDIKDIYTSEKNGLYLMSQYRRHSRIEMKIFLKNC